MISDDDAKQFFKTKFAKQGEFGGSPTSLQLFRGKSALNWEGQHPAGCFRHFAVFNNFNAISRYCFDCYKVLIEPRTVMELFKLLIVFDRLDLPNNNTRKCYCETREFCSGAYKGLVYCRGLDEAHAIAERVGKIISNDISSDVSISIKRGCSEFEHAYPEYGKITPGFAQMEYKEDWKAHEDFVDKNAVFKCSSKNVLKATPYSPTEVFAAQFWLRYAATMGDMSCREVAGCEVPPLPDINRPKLFAPQ